MDLAIPSSSRLRLAPLVHKPACWYPSPCVLQCSTLRCRRLTSTIQPTTATVCTAAWHEQSNSGEPFHPRRPKRNSLQKLVESALEMVEKQMEKRNGQRSQFPLPSPLDPNLQSAGNFAPVLVETPVRENLEVIGILPQSLEGVYLRNGPNPQFLPAGRHHLFDGDGMLHAIRFSDGSVSYSCRFTQTYRLVEEARAGRPLFPKPIGELHGYGGLVKLLIYWIRCVVGIVDGAKGIGVANAGVVFFNGHLLATSEEDLPYEVHITEEGDLETIGRYDFDGQLSSSMIAHPKIDPTTGELFTLSYNVVSPPYLKYLCFSPEGVKKLDVPISLREGTLIHDFAITKNFVIIPDQQMVFQFNAMLLGGSPVFLDKYKIPRFGVMPRYATSEACLQWIDVPNCFIFHICNAWEDEDDDLVVVGSCMTPADSIFNSSEALRSTLYEIRLNRRTGTSTKQEIVALNLEVGKINPNYVGRKARFVYLALAEPWPNISGIVKVDLEVGEVVAKYLYGDGYCGSEAVFVPRLSDPHAAEDDGFLLAFIHNEITGVSELIVLQVLSSSLARVASVQLPSRVPNGFHGLFIPASHLFQQP